jgi:sugar phosphate isomerase/epimerase
MLGSTARINALPTTYFEFMKQAHTNKTSSRRNFLQATGLFSAAVAATAFPSAAAAAEDSSGPNASSRPKKVRVGLELYSVRGEMGRDLPKTLNEVAKMGYEVVEFYSPYFGWKALYAKQVREQLDDLGMRCLSTHNGMESFTAGDKMNHAIELNQILGTRYMVLASAGNRKGVDGWKELCTRLTAAVEELKPHGLYAGYHNHGAEWAKLENGQMIMEVIAANTPKDFALQLDVGTCVVSGVDPVGWVKANPGRIKLMHLKDWARETGSKDKGYRVLFGEGVTPWKELLSAAETVGGAEILLIEQEGSRFPEFETAKKCLENYKALRGNA